MHNRILLLGILAMTIISSGCIKGLQHSDPVIEDESQKTGSLDVIRGNTTVRADVTNQGYTGNVLLTLEILDGSGSVLEESNKVIRMEENVTEEVSIEARVPSEGETYRLSVTSAD